MILRCYCLWKNINSRHTHRWVYFNYFYSLYSLSLAILARPTHRTVWCVGQAINSKIHCMHSSFIICYFVIGSSGSIIPPDMWFGRSTGTVIDCLHENILYYYLIINYSLACMKNFILSFLYLSLVFFTRSFHRLDRLVSRSDHKTDDWL